MTASESALISWEASEAPRAIPLDSETLGATNLPSLLPYYWPLLVKAVLSIPRLMLSHDKAERQYMNNEPRACAQPVQPSLGGI